MQQDEELKELMRHALAVYKGEVPASPPRERRAPVPKVKVERTEADNARKERNAEIVRLRKLGLSYPEIAEQIGNLGPGGVKTVCHRYFSTKTDTEA